VDFGQQHLQQQFYLNKINILINFSQNFKINNYILFKNHFRLKQSPSDYIIHINKSKQTKKTKILKAYFSKQNTWKDLT
jgi:hypothetical protein